MGERVVKSSSQRLKILYLYKILFENTDEQHSLTMPQIVTKLELYGISAARKALYEDIEALRTFGLDIISTKGKYSGYYLASRDFELPELKLLADAVSSSRFLTEKKSAQLLRKIESLTSIHEAKQINRNIYPTNRIKSMNERIYISIDEIGTAINRGRKISFKYFVYDVHKRKVYRDGQRTCSPYAIARDNEQYYLIAYNDKRDTISNFRIDRMENVKILEDAIKPMPEKFDVADYLNSSFSMFSGSEQEVKLRFDNSLINVVLDRFGFNTTVVADRDDSFTVRTKVKTEHPDQFFGWLFPFGDKVEILEPYDLREKYKESLRQALGKMES